MKLYKLIILFFIGASTGFAQQDAQFTHYMYNMSLVNPAYTISDYGDIKLGAFHRSQWVGATGAPTSTMAFGQTVLKNNLQLGFSFINDNIGDIVNENNIFADVAYRMQVSDDSYLSFGLKLGMRFFNANFSSFNLQSGGSSSDVSFNDNINEQFFNFGAGLYYNTEKFYMGLSAPNIIESEYLKKLSTAINGTEAIHVFLTSGYVFKLNEDYLLKPSFLAKWVNGAPLSIDVNANLLMYDKVEIGLGYRLEDAFMGMVGFNVNQSLKIGYSYDYNITNLNEFNSGTHEVMVIYNINNLLNTYDKSPRFF